MHNKKNKKEKVLVFFVCLFVCLYFLLFQHLQALGIQLLFLLFVGWVIFVKVIIVVKTN